jgi:multiple sugar transport system ATP-binding protein
MAQVVLENITKAYPGGVLAVDDVSLTIADEEFVVLVGPSGCGKSTTLRVIAGLEVPDGGTVRIGERVVNDVPPKDRDIAMVFQNYALYPHMTVYGNMSFALRLRMLPGLLSRLFRRAAAKAVHAEIRRRVMRTADLLDIRPLMDRKPRDLSGGQRQRVALGRAIVREPAAFLFDEPLSNLDARLRVTTRAELKRLHRRLRTTTVYVTHDQEEAMTLGDRIVVMKDGKIQQADAAMTTYHRPRNRFVAGFIGMPPMNFFDGTLRAGEGGLMFDEDAPTSLSGSEAGGTMSAGLQAVATADIGVETVAETTPGLTLPTKGFTISLSSLAPSVLERLASWVGRQVVLGVRPEHLSLRPVSGADGLVVSQPLDVRVAVVEPLGGSVDLYMSTARHNDVVARVESPAGEGLAAFGGGMAAVGMAATVHLDVRRAHLFEPGDAGMNLSLETMSSLKTLSSGQPTTELSHATA